VGKQVTDHHSPIRPTVCTIEPDMSERDREGEGYADDLGMALKQRCYNHSGVAPWRMPFWSSPHIDGYRRDSLLQFGEEGGIFAVVWRCKSADAWVVGHPRRSCDCRNVSPADVARRSTATVTNVTAAAGSIRCAPQRRRDAAAAGAPLV